MKNLFLLSLFVAVSATITAQKVAKVTITTSATVKEAIQKCKEAGPPAGYASKDYDEVAGKVTLWKHFPGGNNNEQQVIITSEVKDGKTVLTLRMPHLPNTMGSYIKDLKKYTTKLSLPNKQEGEYWDGIE